MKQPIIIIIFGVNCSGKSTVLAYLRKQPIPAFAVYDLDARGVPDNVSSQWRRKEFSYYINKAIKHAANGKSTIIGGYILPNEVADIIKGRRLRLKYILLDVNKTILAERLRKRFVSGHRLRELKRVTSLNINQCIEENIKHSKQLRKICRKNNYQVLDASISKISVVIMKLRKIINTLF
ncbi:MAG: AAA family ATPase [Patescibacteria group bacterium]